MDWKTLECPRCETRDQFLLSSEKERHLRKCSTCEHWFVVDDRVDSEPGYRIDMLDHPPTCPVNGCDAVVGSEALPEHIIENHDEGLV